METSALQSMKLALMAAPGLSKDALHVHVGLAVFLITALVFRKQLSSPLPWLAVVVVAVSGELLDGIDDVRLLGHWCWRASVHDLVSTLFWPTVLLLFAHFRRRGKAGNGDAAT